MFDFLHLKFFHSHFKINLMKLQFFHCKNCFLWSTLPPSECRFLILVFIFQILPAAGPGAHLPCLRCGVRRFSHRLAKLALAHRWRYFLLRRRGRRLFHQSGRRRCRDRRHWRFSARSDQAENAAGGGARRTEATAEILRHAGGSGPASGRCAALCAGGVLAPPASHRW